MAQTTLLSSVDKSTTYPLEVSISAKDNCGTVIVKYEDSYTPQMFCELPNITVNIYIDDGSGNKALYDSRAISLEVSDKRNAIGDILVDIPTNCTFSITPNFDKFAIISHNNEVINSLDYPGQTIEQYNATLPEGATPVEIWTTPTETFPITLVWDDTNVSAQGGGGGSSEPTSASDVTYSNSSSGLDADNVQGAIDELADEKLDKAPNGITDLIDGSGVIDPSYLPDYLLGQVIYGGNVSTNAVATLTTAAQHKLGTTDATITLTNDTTAITGYEANEGIYYIADADFTFANMDIKTGDWLISTGTGWSKVDNTDSVTGVKGDSETTYRTGNVNITKANIGLGNVDNTSDLNKPISTATQTALDLKFNNSDIVALTKSQYDDIGTSKLSDDKLYLINDYNYVEPEHIYGYEIDTTITDSNNAVKYVNYAKEYINDITPAKMGTTTFDYGSWENAFFMPKPCVIHPDGYVNYYLDPNDYTKKIDGTASDITGADGNVMIEWGKLWYKFEQIDTKQYFFVSNKRVDETFNCWCNINSLNKEIDHFYTAAYNGTGTTKLQSVSGLALTSANGNGGTTVTQEVTRAEANNLTSTRKEWYIDTFADRILINALLILIGKSLNTQGTFGQGLISGSQSTKEAYITGSLNDKGLFWGDTVNQTSGVKVFGMENWWGCCWHRTAGCINVSGTLKVKLTYNTADGTTATSYNETGSGYRDVSSEIGTLPTNNYVQTMLYSDWGYFSKTTSSSSGNNYRDYFYKNDSQTDYLLVGGRSGIGVYAGAFYFDVSAAPSHAYWTVGAALAYKPLG